MDYNILKTEIDTDPKGMGYSGKTDQWCTDKLNELGASGETIIRDSVSTADIITAIYSDKDEFMSLTQIDLMRINLLSPIGDSVNPADIQGVTKEIFTAQSHPTIRAALIALGTRSASRAEKLFGDGTIIYYWDVARARAL